MAYGIKYYGEFTNTAGTAYHIEIHQKDYAGDTITVLLGGMPVKHQWQTDEPKAPIKGSSLTMTLFNDGTLPITDFYSPNDDEYLGYFVKGGDQVLFVGFLVQDDCNELMVDYVHEIVLSFNDNLGLLKDVALDSNPKDFGGWLVTAELDFVSPAPDNFIYLWDSGYTPQIGVPFTITNHIDPVANDTWTPTAVTDYGNGYFVVQVADLAFASDTVAYGCRITDAAATIDFYARHTLLDIIAMCLANTGLELEIFVYDNMFETSHDTNDSPLAQTFIDIRTFLNGEVFDDCYTVITKILSRFYLTLFQANGAWRIIRWDEVRYDPNITAYQYDSGFNLIGTDILLDYTQTGFNQSVYPEVGLQRSIFRPFQFVKETFKYVQPKSLIINADLQTLGAFVGSSSDATYTYNAYEFPSVSKWKHMFTGDPNIDTSVILVKIETATGVEKERAVAQPKITAGGSGVTDFANVQFNDIPVSAGDVFDFELKIKAGSSTGGDAVTWNFGYLLLEDVGNYRAPANWNLVGAVPDAVAPVFASVTILAADAEEYYDYKLSTAYGSQIPKFPVDGILRIRVYGSNTSNVLQPSVSAVWKDIKLTITQNINDSTQITGHIHNDEQALTIKNNEQVDLSLDDSPRNSIAGTLYQVAYTGLVAHRTTLWYRLSNPSEELRIGEITTLEQLFWRRVPRTKLEGTFYGVDGLSMLTVLRNVSLTDLNFVFGSLEIDYKNNSLNCTMWEIFENGEVDGDLTSEYTFKYIYES